MATEKAKAQSGKKSVLPVQVQQVMGRINDRNIRLSMMEYANLVHVLVSRHRIKPTVIEKQTDFSLPHIYNMICLGSMTPKMKSMVVSGKIRGTDALKILRNSKDEKDFIAQAYELSTSKTDLRKGEHRKQAKNRTVNRIVDRKEKVKTLLMEIIGKDKLTPSKTSTLNSLVSKLMSAD